MSGLLSIWLVPLCQSDAPAAGLCPLRGWETAGARSSEVTVCALPTQPVRRLWLRKGLSDALQLSQEAKAGQRISVKTPQEVGSTASQPQLPTWRRVLRSAAAVPLYAWVKSQLTEAAQEAL